MRQAALSSGVVRTSLEHAPPHRPVAPSTSCASAARAPSTSRGRCRSSIIRIASRRVYRTRGSIRGTRSSGLVRRARSLRARGRRYIRRFPLLANVSTARLTNSRSSLTALRPPPNPSKTTPSSRDSTLHHGRALEGRRARVTIARLFAWFGHYRTWAESAANDACLVEDDLENRVYDAALGADLSTEARDSHALASSGSEERLDQSAEPLPAPGESETSRVSPTAGARAHYVFGLAARRPFQSGRRGRAHRRRYQRLGGPEGRLVRRQTSGRRDLGAPRWSFAFGAKIRHEAGSVPSTYFNGEVTFRPTPDLERQRVARYGAPERCRCCGAMCQVFPTVRRREARRHAPLLSSGESDARGTDCHARRTSAS